MKKIIQSKLFKGGAILIALFLVGAGSILVYQRYFQAEPKVEVKPEVKGEQAKVEKYRCPDGMVSPRDGGVFNWDGSTYCVPEPEDKQKLRDIIEREPEPEVIYQEVPVYVPQDNSQEIRNLQDTIESETRKTRDCLKRLTDKYTWNDYCY